jgi:SAM-dependent methyltransferase
MPPQITLTQNPWGSGRGMAGGPSSGCGCVAGRTCWMCAAAPAPPRCLRRRPSVPGGQVIAVDLAGELLKVGQAKAQTAGLQCVEFRRGDMTDLGFPDHHFDAVVCVFGIFFVPDMERQVAELWRMVRPGGQLAITTWGARFWSPAYEIWLEAVRRVCPDLYTAFNPWDRITTPEAVHTLLHDGGARSIDVAAEDGYQALRTPEDFWTMALGSGLRWTSDQMGPELAREVKQEILDPLAAAGVDRVETNVIYAIAEKQSGPA